jgi:hypothetical protein
VGGPITKIVDGYAATFQNQHPDIVVKPVYTGSYQDSLVKAMTAAKASNAQRSAIFRIPPASNDDPTKGRIAMPYECCATPLAQVMSRLS